MICNYIGNMQKLLLTTILVLLWFVPVIADDNCVDKNP